MLISRALVACVEGLVLVRAYYYVRVRTVFSVAQRVKYAPKNATFVSVHIGSVGTCIDLMCRNVDVPMSCIEKTIKRHV